MAFRSEYQQWQQEITSRSQTSGASKNAATYAKLAAAFAVLVALSIILWSMV